jgi:hypothetical protein
MKKGYWMNYHTAEVFEIHEHERWIRAEGNAQRLGVPSRVVARFKTFRPATDRDDFLLFLMQKAPIMRVRGHGYSVTFEFWAKSAPKPLATVRRWAERNAGPLTLLNIVNLARGAGVQVLYKDFAR